MKTIIAIALLIAALTATAQTVGRTNPPPLVTLSWTASVSPAVTGYNLYYGSASGSYTNVLRLGVTNSVQVTNLVRGGTYYFTATSKAGTLESIYTPEVVYTVPFPPAPPTGLGITVDMP